MAEQGYSSWAYSLVDSSQVSTFLISILLIVYGSFRSLNMDCENQEKDKDGNPVPNGTFNNGNTNNSESHIFGIQTIDSTQALFLPIGASVSLLVMFFFFDSVQVVFTICTAVLATIAFAFLLLPMCQYLTRPCSPQNKISFGCCGRFTLAELLSFSLSVMLVLIWVLTGHWLLMDGMSVCHDCLVFVCGGGALSCQCKVCIQFLSNLMSLSSIPSFLALCVRLVFLSLSLSQRCLSSPSLSAVSLLPLSALSLFSLSQRCLSSPSLSAVSLLPLSALSLFSLSQRCLSSPSLSAVSLLPLSALSLFSLSQRCLSSPSLSAVSLLPLSALSLFSLSQRCLSSPSLSAVSLLPLSALSLFSLSQRCLSSPSLSAVSLLPLSALSLFSLSQRCLSSPSLSAVSLLPLSALSLFSLSQRCLSSPSLSAVSLLPLSALSLFSLSQRCAFMSDILSLSSALAMGLCVAMIAFVRLPSLKVSCLLLSGLLIYDVFWVFFSAYIFNSNVMVKVATQPADNPLDVLSRKLHLGPGMGRDVPRLSLPGKLVFPSSTGSHFSMLGIGDIVMPGLLLCFVLRYDNYKKQASGEAGGPGTPGRMGRVSYFHCTLIGYFVGLLTATVASRIHRAAQPALLYLVPFTLLPLLTMAYLKGDLRRMWSEPFHTKASSSRFLEV
uniref:Signal peptide peptidase 3 n=2 Tax=Oncorhynchus kisutch TaxID=8019 RepID=A0A8C7FRI6_ONCKI